MSTVEANCELLTPDGWQIEIGERIIGHGGCGARVELQQIASTTNCYVNPMLYAISASLLVAPSCMNRVESVPDQPLEFLRLRHVGPHLLLSKMGLKCQNVLERLCVGNLFD